jgi:hypothetical protein
MSNQATIDAYRTIYANKYSRAYPLADSTVQTAMDGVTDAERYPYKPDVLLAMKAAADAAVGT